MAGLNKDAPQLLSLGELHLSYFTSISCQGFSNCLCDLHDARKQRVAVEKAAEGASIG